MSSAHDPIVGRELKDYRITDKIGGGAFGAVYRAEHARLAGRHVAVKVLHPHIATDEGMVTRFRREAESLASVNHPNIVQIIDFDWSDEIGLYLVLEWIKGDPLNLILKREKRIPLDVVVDLFSQMLSALQEAHDKGIVHRDLKPANIMIIETGATRTLKVLDFGIAAMVDSEHELTSDGTAMGSANYMSPEQALGQIKKIDTRSDLYSCGIIMGKCLTGKNVYAADSPTQILWKHIYEPPPLLKSLYPEGNFSQALEDVFAKSIAKEKNARFQSGNEFIEALQEAAQEEATHSLYDPDDAFDDGDQTIFDPTYTTGALAALDPNGMPHLDPGSESSAWQAHQDAKQSHTSDDLPVVTAGVVAGSAQAQAMATRGNQIVSPRLAQTPHSAQSSQAAQAAQAAMAARPAVASIPQGSGPAVARVGAPSTGGHPAHTPQLRQPGRHTISPAAAGGATGRIRDVQIRERPTGNNQGFQDPDAFGETSSPSFSTGSMRTPVRTTRSPRNTAIRSAMKQPPADSFWEQYRWWILGGALGAIALLLAVVLVVSAVRGPSASGTQHVDPTKKMKDTFDSEP